jgi:hypothetical protein
MLDDVSLLPTLDYLRPRLLGRATPAAAPGITSLSNDDVLPPGAAVTGRTSGKVAAVPQ